jgi:hypothetical protein
MKLHDLKIFPIDNDDLFEDFCLDIYKILFQDRNAQRNGRRGQRQNGVDIFCHINFPLEWIGIQCKVRNSSESLNINEIKREVENAKAFNPKLSQYIIATTMQRDSLLQEKIRELNQKNIESGFFEVKIDFWEDIQQLLSNQEYDYILLKYYSDFIIDSLKYGYSVGRLVTVHIGVDSEYYSRFELLIAKIPLIDPNVDTGTLYFQNRYLILNLNERSFAIITNDCYDNDLRTCIQTGFDRFVISKWLRNSNIDDIIYSDKIDYFYSCTRDEEKFYVQRYDN